MKSLFIAAWLAVAICFSASTARAADWSSGKTVLGMNGLDSGQLHVGETLQAMTNIQVRSDACETFSVVETVSYGTMLIYEGYYKEKCEYIWVYVKTPHNNFGWVRVDEVKITSSGGA